MILDDIVAAKREEVEEHKHKRPLAVLAESALLSCSMLLTSDEHLRGIDFERLTLELQAFDVAAPVIATPSEIVRKFFRK